MKYVIASILILLLGAALIPPGLSAAAGVTAVPSRSALENRPTYDLNSVGGRICLPSGESDPPWRSAFSLTDPVTEPFPVSTNSSDQGHRREEPDTSQRTFHAHPAAFPGGEQHPRLTLAPPPGRGAFKRPLLPSAKGEAPTSRRPSLPRLSPPNLPGFNI